MSVSSFTTLLICLPLGAALAIWILPLSRYATGSLAVLVSLRGQHGLLKPGPTAPYTELSGALGLLLLGSVLAQSLSYAAFLAATILAKTHVQKEALAGFISAIFVARIPILLFLGLATRIATIPLLGMIAAIQTFVYPNAYNDHLVWGSILVLVLTRGPGVFSLDHLMVRAVRRRRATR